MNISLCRQLEENNLIHLLNFNIWTDYFGQNLEYSNCLPNNRTFFFFLLNLKWCVPSHVNEFLLDFSISVSLTLISFAHNLASSFQRNPFFSLLHLRIPVLNWHLLICHFPLTVRWHDWYWVDRRNENEWQDRKRPGRKNDNALLTLKLFLIFLIEKFNFE